MKKSHLVSSLATSIFAINLLAIPSYVEARTFGYVGIKSGYSYEQLSKGILIKNNKSPYLNPSFASGIPLSASIGIRNDFNPRFGMRAEAEYSYRFGGNFKANENQNANTLAKEPQAELQNLLINLYFDYYLDPWTNLYLDSGIGLGSLYILSQSQESPKNKISTFKITLAWQIGLGIAHTLRRNLDLDFNLRYVDFGKGLFFPQGNNAIDYPFFAIEALIGLKYYF